MTNSAIFVSCCAELFSKQQEFAHSLIENGSCPSSNFSTPLSLSLSNQFKLAPKPPLSRGWNFLRSYVRLMCTKSKLHMSVSTRSFKKGRGSWRWERLVVDWSIFFFSSRLISLTLPFQNCDHLTFLGLCLPFLRRLLTNWLYGYEEVEQRRKPQKTMVCICTTLCGGWLSRVHASLAYVQCACLAHQTNCSLFWLLH